MPRIDKQTLRLLGKLGHRERNEKLHEWTRTERAHQEIGREVRETRISLVRGLLIELFGDPKMTAKVEQLMRRHLEGQSPKNLL